MEQAGQPDSVHKPLILLQPFGQIRRQVGNPVRVAPCIYISLIHNGAHRINNFHIALIQLLISPGKLFVFGADKPVELAVMNG